MLIILATASEWTSKVNARDDSNMGKSKSKNIESDPASRANATAVGNTASIITPWNTGNAIDNGDVSRIG